MPHNRVVYRNRHFDVRSGVGDIISQQRSFGHKHDVCGSADTPLHHRISPSNVTYIVPSSYPAIRGMFSGALLPLEIAGIKIKIFCPST
jgi:hypothetical protein